MNFPRFFHQCLVFVVCACAAAFHGAGVKAAAPAWDAELQGRLITSVARGLDGQLWVGVEDKGVWRYDPAAPAGQEWKLFTAQEIRTNYHAGTIDVDGNNRATGLGDNNAYALAVDGKGRVWCGHRNQGVSVWNGRKWKNYNLLDGLPGMRVFDIAVCPSDGAVWIATEGGLARYSVKEDTWRIFSRLEGLPSDQIQAIDFDKAGNIIVGTQCDGVALSDAKSDYRKWRVVSQWAETDYEPSGSGLPSGLINDVLIAQDGFYYVATDKGLAQSRDAGKTWDYIRGRDYAAKVRDSIAGLPYKRWKEKLDGTLAEDYITCLAQDAQGFLWIGHRQQPYEVFDPKTQERVWSGEQDFALKTQPGSAAKPSETPRADDYVWNIVPLPDGAPLIARYGGALTQSAKPFIAAAKIEAIKIDSNSELPFPSVAKVPDEVELAALIKRVEALPKPVAALPKGKALVETKTPKTLVAPQKPLPTKMFPAAAYLDEDWLTMGDWLGRYGKQHAILWAMEAPYSGYFNSTLYGSHMIQARIGPHYRDGDALRHWIHWEKTDNPNSLYYADEPYRRQAEIDDHGEAYPQSFEGPDEWMYVEVPQGIHRMSLYFFNKDGDEGANRYRDFLIEVKACNADPEKFKNEKYWSPGWVGSKQQPQTYSDEQIALADAQPALAQARVHQFRGGVYKNFSINGPGRYWVKISKNNSLNVICSGIFIDRLQGLPTKPEDSNFGLMLGDNAYRAPDINIQISYLVEKDKKGRPTRGLEYTPLEPLTEKSGAPHSLQLALHLWRALDASYDREGNALLQRRFRLMAFRAANKVDMDQPHTFGAGQAPKQQLYIGALLDNWRWQLSLWDDHASDRQAFEAATAFMYQQFKEAKDAMAPSQRIKPGEPGY